MSGVSGGGGGPRSAGGRFGDRNGNRSQGMSRSSRDMINRGPGVGVQPPVMGLANRSSSSSS